MKRRNRYKWIGILLLVSMLATLLTGCESDFWENFWEITPVVEEKKEEEPVAEPIVKELTDADKSFTLQYNPHATMNPLYSFDVYNEVAISLVYEGLFRLDANFVPQPVLCTDWSTEDGLRYRFDIAEVTMHDGSPLRPSDVAYTINEARNCKRYASRLNNIKYCFVSDSGQLIIDLEEVDYTLPSLLDIPIIEYGSGEAIHPVGTGPYVFKTVGEFYMLRAFEDYRDASDISLSIIFLQEFSTSETEASFFDASMDLVWEDTSLENPLNLHGDYEARYYDSAILQFIGFNCTKSSMLDENLRKAISYAVDRQEIVEDIYDGKARATHLLLNPAHYLYDESWGEDPGFSVSMVSQYLAAAGMEDFNSDGYLEYPIYGSWQTLTIRFLVYEGNSRKVAAARSIANSLGRVGLNVKVVTAGWDDYIFMLRDGQFEMYYAEVSVTRNFDFSRLLGKDGSLVYGGISTNGYTTLCNAVLRAKDDTERAEAWKTLCQTVQEGVPIVPVLYRQYGVYTHRGVVNGLKPTASGIFQSVTEWSIDLPS